MRRSIQNVLFAIVAGAVFAGSAQAAAPENCPTLLPDFQCDRHGRYAGFVAPMSMPYLFEDPFITTGAYLWGLWHDFPESSVFEGGDATIAALQLRVALTDRLAFVASQDGRTSLHPDLDLLDSEKGYMDLIAGLKFALIDRPDDRFILSTSLRYKLASGTGDILQGKGDGGWIPQFSVGWGAGPVNLIADAGMYYPIDGNAEVSFGFWNVHLGYPVTPKLVPFVEVNGIRYFDDGDGTTTVKTSLGYLPISTVQSALGLSPFEAVDYGNLGSDDVAQNDYITGAVGLRFAVAPRVSLGASYERPLSKRREITKQRATLSLAFEM
jgi:hypothetical protein